jgi:hypothetical protein
MKCNVMKQRGRILVGTHVVKFFAAEVGKPIFFDELPQQHLANTGALKWT